MAGSDETRGIDSDAPTAAETAPGPAPGPTPSAALAGYDLGGVLGRGGMGEVIEAHDRRIDREIAVKRLRGDQPSEEAVARFLREAKIQARLDHPAIVPVHELGTDDRGLPYFTMKRLEGVTLAARIADRAPQPELLRAFVDVCFAVERAHERGIVHRNLKPANIMVGRYGDVYVLDWGVARVLGEPQRPSAAKLAATGNLTATGALLGTPGYMAPEQVNSPDVGSAADVYALGAILFELLTGEPLHPRGEAALASTVSSPQQAPALRAPDRTIAPELDAACRDALVENPAARPTARALAERVQAYLDGDRNLARRRELATEALAAAQAALAAGGDDARATAMRHAGRAIGLDPESPDAGELVSKLLLEPPSPWPPALVARLADANRETGRVRSRTAFVGYVAGLAVLMAGFAMGVQGWKLPLLFAALVGVTAGNALLEYRTGRDATVVSLVLNFLLILVLGRIASPLILVPMVTLAVLNFFTLRRPLLDRAPLLLLWTLAVMVVPLALEWTHLLPPSWGVLPGGMWVRSDVYRLTSASDAGWIAAVNIGLMLTCVAWSIAISRARYRAQDQLRIQAWHLEQLLPQHRRR